MFKGLLASALFMVMLSDHFLLLADAEAAASENTLHQLRCGGIESLVERR